MVVLLILESDLLLLPIHHEYDVTTYIVVQIRDTTNTNTHRVYDLIGGKNTMALVVFWIEYKNSNSFHEIFLMDI